jgi:hypothetical protein
MGGQENVGGQYYRIELEGRPDAKVLHIELRNEPTKEQALQLQRLAEKAKGMEDFGENVEVVVNWPKGGTVATWLPNLVPVAMLGLDVLGAYGRELRSEAQLEETGYAPVGVAAYGKEDVFAQAGAFFRGAILETIGLGQPAFNTPVWREDVRSQLEFKAPGQTTTVTWQTQTTTESGHPVFRNELVTYQMTADRTWVVVGNPGFTPPDLNKIIDPNVTDAQVEKLLGITERPIQ